MKRFNKYLTSHQIEYLFGQKSDENHTTLFIYADRRLRREVVRLQNIQNKFGRRDNFDFRGDVSLNIIIDSGFLNNVEFLEYMRYTKSMIQYIIDSENRLEQLISDLNI